MEIVKHETCQQYVARRLSEGWRIVYQKGYHLILSPPDGNILRSIDLRNDIETLDPNAPGDETALTLADTTNWGAVSDIYDATRVYRLGTTYARDLYNLADSGVGAGTINSITIFFRIASSHGDYIGYGKPVQKSGDTVTEGTEQSVAGATYVTKSQEYTENPATSAAYTWEEIDALQIGVALKSNDAARRGRCSKVYVEVDYTPPAVTAPIVATQDATGIGFD